MSNIFLDREKLSPRYLPQNLVHRGGQVRLLNSFYEDTLDHIDNVFLRICQVVGGVGTGKTCTVRKFSLHLQEEASKRKKNLLLNTATLKNWQISTRFPNPTGLRWLFFPIKIKGASAGWVRPVAIIEE